MNPAMDRPEIRADLAAVRRQELARATEIIGYDDVVMLGYRDSGMPDTEANQQPDALRQRPARRGRRTARRGDPDRRGPRSSSRTRRSRPRTPTPTTSGSTRSRWSPGTRPATRRATRRPAPPWAPSKLYYTVWPRRRMLAMHEKFLELGLESPFDDQWLARMQRTEPQTTSIDLTGFADVRADALRAHATQVDPTSPFWFGLPPEVAADAPPVRRLLPCRAAGSARPGPGSSRTTSSPGSTTRAEPGQVDGAGALGEDQ